MSEYTAFIESGEINTGAEFLTLCAKAFIRNDGALTAAVQGPVALDTSLIARKCVAVKELERLTMLSPDEIQNEFYRERDERGQYLAVKLEELESAKRRYEQVKQAVLDWQPPTLDHTKLKSFALHQIGSVERKPLTDLYQILADAQKETYPDAKSWYADRVSKQSDVVAEAERLLACDAKMVAAQNKWLEILRDSLNGAP